MPDIWRGCPVKLLTTNTAFYLYSKFGFELVALHDFRSPATQQVEQIVATPSENWA